jgi:ABC-type multidrug transport system fused ATPase/permease subunit
MQKRLDDVNDTLQENLTAIRAVKAFVRVGHERTKFKKVNDATPGPALPLSRIILMLPVLTIILTALRSPSSGSADRWWAPARCRWAISQAISLTSRRFS